MPLRKLNRWQELEVNIKIRFLDPGATADETFEATAIFTAFMAVWIILIISTPVFFIYGEMVAGVTLAIFLPLSIGLVFAYFRSDEKPRLLKILMVLGLVVAALVDISFGGVSLSGGVVFWGIPIVAVCFAFLDNRFAFTMFFVYILLIIISINFASYFSTENKLPRFVVRISSITQIVGCGTVAMLMLKYYFSQLKVARAALQAEKAKSEALLLNILPEVIAARLRSGEKVIADAFDEVSVLFADIVGFTPMSVSMSPRETVVILNEIFSAFDRLAVKHGVEKIRTIGDGYMAVAGAPVPQSDHAQRVVQMALDMQKFLQHRAVEMGGDALKMRIGINSGAAIAGIVGTTKFHYDLWGDAVNTASRMESLGKPDNIQIAEPTYLLVKEKFNCLSRGLIEIKGKGTMNTWFVVDENWDQAAP
jgi:adenylate cyclase